MTRLRLPRSSACAALAALLFGATTSARAQGILGRVRDRARQAVTGNQTPQTCSPSDYNRASQSEVSDDVVTRYLRAAAAHDAELRRIAATNTPEGRYFSAMLRRDSLARRHAAFRRHVGPDWARYQAIQNQPMTSSDPNVYTQRSRQMAQIEQDINEDNVQMPPLDWNAQQSANARIDNAALQTGNFDICAWSVVVDIIPTVVQSIAADRREGKPERGATEFIVGRQGGLRVAELRVIRAHAAELARAIGEDYPSDAEVAEMQRQQAQQQAAQNAMAAWQACQQRAAAPTGSVAGMGMNPDSMRVWQQQLEDAQKRGDQATLMSLGMKMGMAMQAGGMAQRAQAVSQAQQACGPMPGAAPGAPK